jgi:hypothetical protein
MLFKMSAFSVKVVATIYSGDTLYCSEVPVAT